MSSRPSSTNSVADGRLPPPPKRVKVRTHRHPDTWLVIPSFTNTVAQLLCYVQTRLSLSTEVEYDLYLDGSLILLEEKMDVVRDGDRLHVYPSGQTPTPQDSHGTNPSSTPIPVSNALAMHPPWPPAQRLSSSAQAPGDPSDGTAQPFSATANNVPPLSSSLLASRRVRSAEGRRRRNARNRRREKRRRIEAREAKALGCASNSANCDSTGSDHPVSVKTLKRPEPQPQDIGETLYTSPSEMKNRPPRPDAIVANPLHMDETVHDVIEGACIPINQSPMLRVRNKTEMDNCPKVISGYDGSQSEAERCESQDIIEIEVSKDARGSSGALHKISHNDGSQNETERFVSPDITDIEVNKKVRESLDARHIKASSASLRRLEQMPKASLLMKSPTDRNSTCEGSTELNHCERSFSREGFPQDRSRTSMDLSTNDKNARSSAGLAVIEDVLEMVMNPSRNQHNKLAAYGRKSNASFAYDDVASRADSGMKTSTHGVKSSSIFNGLSMKGRSSSISAPQLSSSLSLSIAPSEYENAGEINPVVTEKQNLHADLSAEIEDILEVLDKGNLRNRSPTAVASSILDEKKHDKITSTMKDARAPEIQVQSEKTNDIAPPLKAVTNIRLAPSDATERMPSLKLKLSHKKLNCPLSENDISAEEDRKDLKRMRISSESLRKESPNIVNTRKALDIESDQGAHSHGFVETNHYSPQGIRKIGSSIAKKRRLDNNYTFSGEETISGPAWSLTGICKAHEQYPKERKEMQAQQSIAQALHTANGKENKSLFLDEVLDLEKSLYIPLPQISESHDTLGGKTNPQTSKEREIMEHKDVIRYGREPDAVEAKADDNESPKEGASLAKIHREVTNSIDAVSQDNDDLVRVKRNAVSELLKGSIVETTALCEADNKKTCIAGSASTKKKGINVAEEDRESTKKKRRQGALSVSAALRFVREQNMLQDSRIGKKKSSESEVGLPESFCLSPKPKKRKKNKKKKTKSFNPKQLIYEDQHNESVWVGFGNDSNVQEQQNEQHDIDNFMLPPPFLLESCVDMRDPSLFISRNANEDTVEHTALQIPLGKTAIHPDTHLKHNAALDDGRNVGFEPVVKDLSPNIDIAPSGANDKTHEKAKDVEIQSIEPLDKEATPTEPIVNGEGLGIPRDFDSEKYAPAQVFHPPPDTNLEDGKLNQSENTVDIDVQVLKGGQRKEGAGDRTEDVRQASGNRMGAPPSTGSGMEHGIITLLHENSEEENAHDNYPELIGSSENRTTERQSQYDSQCQQGDEVQKQSVSDAPGGRLVKYFEGKRKFFDDIVTLMIDTSVELEYFCKKLFRVKGKTRGDNVPHES